MESAEEREKRGEEGDKVREEEEKRKKKRKKKKKEKEVSTVYQEGSHSAVTARITQSSGAHVTCVSAYCIRTK